jgi:hypothetical protein
MISSLRVFIASPSELCEERDTASHVISEVSRIFGERFQLNVQPVRWETHAVPDVGDDVQDVLNRQIGEVDVLVGVMWRRFGTPTKRAGSGTGEEFERAYLLFKKYGRPKIMFYFRTTPFYTSDIPSITQFRKVAEFRRKLEKLGVLYWTYKTPLEFERNVREHLIRRILALLKQNGETSVVESFNYREARSISLSRQATIFIAYSHKDNDVARSVHHALRAAGYDVWIDQECLLPGQMWLQEVERGLQMSDVVLLLLSSNSNLADGFMAKELEILTQRLPESNRPTLVPVRLDNTEPPIGFRQLQWIDYFTRDGLQRLLEALDRAPLRTHDNPVLRKNCIDR